MKKTVLFATALFIGMAVMAQTKLTEAVKFNAEKHDFGKIKQGKPVVYYFEITNIGDKPLVVENVSSPCGCTVPEKPVKPIMPGKQDKIKVEYNAAAVAPFTKDITIKFAGIDEVKIVSILGEVVP